MPNQYLVLFYTNKTISMLYCLLIMSSYDKIIKDHYDTVAKSDKDSATSTMSNNFIRESETNFIVNQIAHYIKNKDIDESQISFIDVGCGNGYQRKKRNGGNAC